MKAIILAFVLAAGFASPVFASNSTTVSSPTCTVTVTPGVGTNVNVQWTSTGAATGTFTAASLGRTTYYSANGASGNVNFTASPFPSFMTVTVTSADTLSSATCGTLNHGIFTPQK